MSRTSTVYKVVHKPIIGGRCSAFMVCYNQSGLNPTLRLHYTPGKYTHPEIGKIFCFDTLQAARGWCYCAHKPFQIWQATALDAKEPKFKAFCSSPHHVRTILERFWNGEWDEVIQYIKAHVINISSRQSESVPAGTLVCRALRLDKLLP